MKDSERWSWQDLASALIIAVAIGVATYRYWWPGLTGPYDPLMAIYRAFELARSWHMGIWYPRLGPDWNFTYGAPLFEFYPPLVSFGTVAFQSTGLGWIEAGKAMTTLSLLLAGMGGFVYARWLFNSRLAGLMGGLAYALSPYLLLDIYYRGAAAESLALGILPWAFWAGHHVLRSQDKAWTGVSAATIALLILAHNVTALFALPFLGLYLCLMAWRERAWARVPTLGAALLLGLALSAFYWGPALAERQDTHLDATMITGILSPVANLKTPDRLLAPGLVTDYWGNSLFRVSLWQLLLGGAAVLLLAWRGMGWRTWLGYLCCVVFLCLLFQLKLTAGLWTGLPLIRYIQFPWRLLGIVSFCIALAIGAAFAFRPLSTRAGWLVALCALALIGYGGLDCLLPAKSPHWWQIDSSQIGLADLYQRGGQQGFALFYDYLPAWAVSNDWNPGAIPPAPVKGTPMPSAPALQVTQDTPAGLALHVQAASPFSLKLHRFFYPGWQIQAGNRALPVTPGGPFGLVSATMPAGDYTALLKFGETPLRLGGDILSVLALASCCVTMGTTRLGRSTLAASALLLGALLALAAARGAFAWPTYQPSTSPANFEDQLELLGYGLGKSAWQPGDVLSLRLYWLAEQNPAEDYKVFIHLVPYPDGGAVAQEDTEPIGGFDHTSRWEAGELVEDDHSLSLPVGLAPGKYRVEMGVYRQNPVQNLRVSGARLALPGDRVVLTDITIGGDQRAVSH